MTKRNKLVAVVVLQVGLILSLILINMSILVGGQEVLLKIQPVDPRSPLRGDYMTFEYSISRLSRTLVANTDIQNGDTVFVLLDRQDYFYQAKEVTKHMPKSGLFIRGKLLNDKSGINDLHVTYGIEEYFIPEGKGRNFSSRGKEMSAKVILNNQGDASIKNLLVNGEIWP